MTDADGVRVGGGQKDQTDLRSFLASLLGHFDGCFVRRGTQISLGRWPVGNIDTSTLPVIGSDDLYREDLVKPTGRDDNVTEVIVAFKNRKDYYIGY